MNKVDYLIISNTVSTDFICYRLQQLGKKYLRINRDRFGTYKILYTLESDSLIVNIGGNDYEIRIENRILAAIDNHPFQSSDSTVGVVDETDQLFI